MPDGDGKRPYRGPSKVAQTSFNDEERKLIQAYADQEGISFEDAASQLASIGIAKRVKKRTGKRPSSSVIRFRK